MRRMARQVLGRVRWEGADDAYKRPQTGAEATNKD
jgi:hypothetical protein